METRWTIINLEIRLKGISDWLDWKYYLTVLFYSSISYICPFLDVQFMDIPRSAISISRGSNYLSSCICVILKPCCRYSLLKCLIPSSVLFTIRFLIILHVANIMFQYVVFRKPGPLMCMMSQNRVNFLYILRMPLGEFDTMIGSTCCIFRWTVLPCKFGTLVT